MTGSVEIHVYLAGPDVFFPDAAGIGKRKKAFVEALGMVGHFPFDNEVDVASFSDKKAAALHIAALNESMMRNCIGVGRFGVILANIAPFHGPSADVGTAFEIGYMAALSHFDNVLIVGYTDDARDFSQRVADDIYGGQVGKVEGRLKSAHGFSIEDFGLADNLMLIGAIERTGGKVFPTFEAAASYAANMARNRIAAISQLSP